MKSPLGNVFFFRSQDPAARHRVAQRLRESPGISLHTGDDWVLGVECLPGPPMPVRKIRGAWIVVAEGGDLISDEDLRRWMAGQEEELAWLTGDAAFLVITENTVVVRSCGGLVPWYTSFETDRDVVSTRIAYLWRFLDEVRIDRLVFAALSVDGSTMPDRRSPVEGFRALEAGHLEHAQRGRVRRVDYWRPLSLVDRDLPDGEIVGEIARRLRAAIDRDWSPTGRTLLGMSGGVDSSSLACVARLDLGLSFGAFTLDVPPDRPGSYRERGMVADIASAVSPSRHIRVDLSPQRRVESHILSTPTGMPVAHPALCYCPQWHAMESFDVYTGGEIADDLFVGPYLWRADWLDTVGWRDVPVLLRARGRGRLGVRGRALAGALWAYRLRAHPKRRTPFPESLPPMFRTGLREEFGEWSTREAQAVMASCHPWRFMHAVRGMDGWLAQNWEQCSELGVRRSVPFGHRALLELAYSSHPKQHAMPPKRLLRQAMRDRVPASILYREDKGAQREVPTVSKRAFAEDVCSFFSPGVLSNDRQSTDYALSDAAAILEAALRAPSAS